MTLLMPGRPSGASVLDRYSSPRPEALGPLGARCRDDVFGSRETCHDYVAARDAYVAAKQMRNPASQRPTKEKAER